MKTRAAILWEVNQPWSVEEIELDPPKKGEVLVKTKAAGMCHSDEHLVTGDLFAPPEVEQQVGRGFLPMIGGHEGSGVVLEVGEGVTAFAPGDHVAASFIPSCGRCHWCATGHQNLCDLGMHLFGPGQITDFTDRHHARGKDLWTFTKLGTFAEHMVVSEASLVKVDKDYPFPAVALVSCGVATGFGSAVQRAEVKPGDTVVVIGVGGVGANAVQGARMAGAARIIAVDPVEFKREKAQELGATHAAKSMEEAFPMVQEMTAGVMADKAIITVGRIDGDMIAPAMALVSKTGTVVVTAMGSMAQTDAKLPLFELAMFNKEIKGSIYGSGNPRSDIPRLLSLYRQGKLKLDELITKTYTLDQINEGYQAMRDGKNIRGVILFN